MKNFKFNTTPNFSPGYFIGFPLAPIYQHDSPGKHCRRRKARTVFSDQQLNGLEKRFEAQRYLSTPERVELANQLSLSETQVGEDESYISILNFKKSWLIRIEESIISDSLTICQSTSLLRGERLNNLHHKNDELSMYVFFGQYE